MKTESHRRFLIPVIFFVWLTVLLAAFFVVQKPTWVSVISGLGYLLSTVLFWFLFVCAGAGFGSLILDKISNSIPVNQKTFFSVGLGMGVLGLLGFLFVVLGITNQWFLLFVITIAFLFTIKYMLNILGDIRILYQLTIRSIKFAPHWIPFFSILLFSLSFLLSLAPPIEAFDGLFYHLTVPTWWLRDGGIQLINLPHYWFPSLLEGMFIFPLAFGLDSTPQLIHLTFGLLSLSLIFSWTQSLFGSRAAWWAIAISLSMPSLPWLSAWAYTDLGLAFYSIATLYALSNWKKESSNSYWLILSGVFCGFAMGIKYTAFILPVTCCLCIILWKKHSLRILFESLMKFSGLSLLVGGAWYLRNLIWTGNPVYPFVFGGPFWDSFRAEWYAGAGSGIGWDLKELILLPFITTFGFRDENYFDGRMGPFYLILFPLILYLVWQIYRTKPKQYYDVTVLVVFGLLSVTFWVYSVIQTHHLMQARLLFPALLALVPLFGKSILKLESLNLPKVNFRFIFSTVFAITVSTFCLDFALLVFFRNPVMAAIGSESREAYTERFNNGYAQLLSLSEQTPQDAFIYLINEPRSYGINRLVQPDPINDNIEHDFYLYATNQELILAWKQIGYSHILVRSFIFDSSNENQHSSARLAELRQMLIEIDSTEEYVLFQIP